MSQTATAAVYRGAYDPGSAAFPLPLYALLPASLPFADPEPVLSGPDALLYYGICDCAGAVLRLVKQTPTVLLYY